MDTTGTANVGGSQLLSVTCNHCGAPLSVPDEARFVTCTYCGTRLEVLRSGGAAYTQVLNNIDQRTERIEQDVAELKVRERLDQLDREWMIQREGFMVHDQNGNASLPSAAGAIAGSVIAGVFGIFWICFTAATPAPGFVSLFGVVFIVVAIGGGISAFNKVGKYGVAERKYQQHRRELLDELNRK